MQSFVGEESICMSIQDNHRSSHFDLDLNKLDQHLLDQAKLMYEYSQQLAEAKRQHARSKRKVKYVEAKIKQEIRNEPAKFTNLKLTEDCVKELVQVHAKFQQVQREAEELAYQQDLLQGMVDSLTDRKHSLQDFTKLWSQGYFAEPRLPPVSRQAVDDLQTDRAFGPKKRLHD